jgi:hypothetical protein
VAEAAPLATVPEVTGMPTVDGTASVTVKVTVPSSIAAVEPAVAFASVAESETLEAP